LNRQIVNFQRHQWSTKKLTTDFGHFVQAPLTATIPENAVLLSKKFFSQAGVSPDLFSFLTRFAGFFGLT
jgi:hypothetical protein